MLAEIGIRNFALIDSVKLEFGAGLNIISGETGAGKSIIVQAIQLLLGGRGGSHLIRTGAEEARIEAYFEYCGREDLTQRLENMGVEGLDTLVIVRTISRSGKGRTFVNGSPSTFNMAAQIAGEMVSIAGQHEYQVLLRPQSHLVVLDAFGGLSGARLAATEAYNRWRYLRSQYLKRLDEQRADSAKKEILSFQLMEIEEADLKPQEEAELLAEKNVLVSAEKLRDWASNAYDVLYGSSGSVTDKLSQARGLFRSLVGIDKTLATAGENLDTAYFQVEEAALQLRDYVKEIHDDPKRLETVEERIQKISKLKKKYGGQVQDILNIRDEIKKNLTFIRTGDEELSELEAAVAAAEGRALSLAKELSGRRKDVAVRLSEEVSRSLESLHMPGTKFFARFKPVGNELQALSENGIDEIQFLISPNVGEELKALSQIASGGELSRITLALKGLLAGRDRIESIIFDEIDAGMGGAVAETVGYKLRELARHHQVICITHLPQIACLADRHYKVIKEHSETSTEVRIERLDGDSCVEEIARMLGGLEISEKTRAHAREMIAKAAKKGCCIG